MLVHELLDVPLVARLRPAALVVPPGRVLGAVDDLLELSGAQPEQLTALAPDDRDDRAVPAPDERHERREVELAPDAHLVGDRLGQREHAPDVVEAGDEDREPLGPVARELVLEVVGDPLEVGLQRPPGAGRA